ncbi:MAG: hypothetical protein AB2L24_05775 [Mangrovibacterium sp.]
MQKTIVIIILLLLSVLSSHAQTDSVFQSFEKEFQSFLDSIEQDHKQFLSENDSIFMEFLQLSWKSYNSVIPETKEEWKPVVQPVIQKDSVVFELNSETAVRPAVPGEKQIERDSVQITSPETLLSKAAMKEVNYYGLKANLCYYTDQIPALKQVSNQGIASFFYQMASAKEWDFNLDRLQQLKQKSHLNDWGFFCLVKKASECFFENQNEQKLFTWYMLLKSNYEIKTGYCGNDILIMLPAVQQIYNTPFLNVKGKNYYLLDHPMENSQSIFTYDSSYPGTKKIFSFHMNEYPLFELIPISKTIIYKEKKIELQIDISMIDFFSTIPFCPLATYFHPHLKPAVWAPLDSLFISLFINKTKREKIDILLDFIQTAIPYQTDQQQFGKERYLFAEECLFYPYADCEDRTILLAQMVRHYTGLSSVALDFPGHVALAVNLGENETGTFIRYTEQKFVICDPTYIHAKSGMLPDEFKNAKALIIDWDSILYSNAKDLIQ